MSRQKYVVLVSDSLMGVHPRHYFMTYNELLEYLDRLDNLNRKYSGEITFYWSVYRRDFKAKEWVYMGVFDHV